MNLLHGLSSYSESNPVHSMPIYIMLHAHKLASGVGSRETARSSQRITKFLSVSCWLMCHITFRPPDTIFFIIIWSRTQ